MGSFERSTSGHLPAVSGNIESVTGSLVVDTGLRQVRTFGANLNAEPAAASAAACAVLTPATNGANAKLTLHVKEDDMTTDSAAAASVSWWAIGE